MAVTLVVIILVALVSLYDFFSSRSWQQVTSTSRNDVVFEHRNQAYGAYAIRKDYDKKIVLIVLALCVLIGGSFGTYKYIKSLPEPTVEETPIDMTQFDLPPEPEEEVIPPPIEEPPPPMEETIAFPEPVIEDDEVKEEIAIMEETQDTKAAQETQEGNEDFVQDIQEEKKVVVVEEPDVIETVVDEEASFPGGAGALNAFLSKNVVYPPTAIEEELQGTCWVGFVVDKSGNISNVAVLRGVNGCPECDKEAIRVVKLVPKWTPAKKNGKSVKSNYRVPIKYVLQ